MGNGTDKKYSLQSINIQPRRPVNYAPNAEAEGKAHILEYYNKGDWETVAEYCAGGISSFIKDLPTPILTGERIYYFHYGALAFKNLGQKDKYLLCLKVLYSLRDYDTILESDAKELLNSGVDKYESLSKELGVDYLNDIQVADIPVKKSGCFIATACYGSYDAPEVVLFRKFRDEVLQETLFGRIFIKTYYYISPPIADFISHRELLKGFIRDILDKLPIYFNIFTKRKGGKR